MVFLFFSEKHGDTGDTGDTGETLTWSRLEWLAQNDLAPRQRSSQPLPLPGLLQGTRTMEASQG